MPYLDSDTKTQWRVTYQIDGYTHTTAPMASQMSVARSLWLNRGQDGLSVVEETVVTTRRTVDPAEFVPALQGGG